MPVIRSNHYSITVGKHAFKALSAFLAKKAYTAYFILCDENTLVHCLPTLITHCPELGEAQIIEIESGEASKSIEFCTHIWQTLLENQAGTGTLLINLGGGVVSDLGGFNASVYKRGIDFINLPTSLLAMADASVGGKTGIDFNGIKNSIGTFAQPKAVFVYPAFLDTLPRNHYHNGLAEVLKIALVSDASFWMELKAGRLSLAKLLGKSIALKNTIVLEDPFDKGRRKILNFGHTIGHAIESLLLGTPQELLHGEAILLGMLMESHVSFQKKLISKKILDDVRAVLLSSFKPALPVNLLFAELMKLMGNDKKTSGRRLQFALMDGIGSCRFDVAVSEEQVKKAMDYYLTLAA